MESYLFADVEAAADTMVVEGYHKPGSLTRSSGAWIHAAGTAMFEAGRRPIKPHDQWIWFAVEAGEATLVWQGHELTLKQQEFVKAAIVTGADTKRIIVKHLIPNMMGPIMVNMAMQIPSAIFNEAFLSFVGLGISAPMASWGTLCNDALAGIYVYPYQMVYPAIAISVTILTFNLLSDGLRDAFDPKQRK